MLMTCGGEEVHWFDFSLYPVDGEGQGQSFLCKNHQCLCSNVWVLSKEHKIISIAQVHQVKVEVDAEVWAVLKCVCEPFVNSDAKETGAATDPWRTPEVVAKGSGASPLASLCSRCLSTESVGCWCIWMESWYLAEDTWGHSNPRNPRLLLDQHEKPKSWRPLLGQDVYYQDTAHCGQVWSKSSLLGPSPCE